MLDRGRWRVRGRFARSQDVLVAILESVLETMPQEWYSLGGYAEGSKLGWRAIADASDVPEGVDERVARILMELDEEDEPPIVGDSPDAQADLRDARRWEQEQSSEPWYRWISAGREIMSACLAGWYYSYHGEASVRTQSVGFYPFGQGECVTRLEKVRARMEKDHYEQIQDIAAGYVLLSQEPKKDEPKKEKKMRSVRGRARKGKA